MTRSRIWLWPNLLSLDAPLVALLWQVLFVRCFHANLGGAAEILLGMAVWLIYAGDRLLDAWRGLEMTPRHQFYREHWAVVVPVWFAVFSAGLWIAATQLPPPLWRRGWIVGLGAGLYLVAVHGLPGMVRRVKEAAVGVVFAIGVSLAAWPMVRTWEDVLAIVMFCGLCWSNCVAIEDWEAGREARGGLWWVAALVAVTALVLLREHRPVLACAETASAMFLVALDRKRERLSNDALRVLADVALLSPVLFLHVAGTVV